MLNRSWTFFVALAAALPVLGQEPGRVAAAYSKFRAWPVLRQLAFLTKLERTAAGNAASFDPFAADPIRWESLPITRKPPYFDPRDWNEDGAPTRRVTTEGTESWKSRRQEMPQVQLLPDLKRSAWYDWGEGKIVRRSRPLSPEERCANLLRGFPPGTDILLARVQQSLDDDPRMRKLGRYFEHCYADLQANVYEGITLYDAWASGAQLAMPDIEVIAFAQWMLDDDSLHAPIPGDQSAPIFTEMAKAALEFRKYRTLREVMAGALVARAPTRDARYAPLAGRCHWLWATFQADLSGLRGVFAALTDRDDVVAAVDAEVVRDEAQAKLRDGFGIALEEQQQKQVRAVLEEIERGG